VFHRRHILVIVLEGVESVRVGGNDAARTGGADCLGVMVAQRQKQRLFAESPHIVPAVALLGAEDAEIPAQTAQDACHRPSDRLRPIVVRGNAVGEEQGLQAAAVRDRDGPLRPVGALLLQLSKGIPAALQRFERLVEGLRRLAVVDQATP